MKLARSPLSSQNAGSAAMDAGDTDFAPSVEERTPLAMENEVDGMANEQTWPTEEELAGNPHGFADDLDDAQEYSGAKKMVPKGTSNYQAAWYAGSDDDEFVASDNEDTEDQAPSAQDLAADGDDDESEEEMVEVDSGGAGKGGKRGTKTQTQGPGGARSLDRF